MAAHHVGAIQRLAPLGRLVALSDPSESALRALAQKAPEARLFADPAEMLATEPLDLVHICTPPSTHGVLARRALEAGCHIYVEKPFAPSQEETSEILELAAARGLKVCAGHQLLFEPPGRRMRELASAIGSIVHVESYFAFRPVRRSPGGRTPLRADLQLLDILPHPVYLLLEALGAAAGTGEPTEVVSLSVSSRGTVHAIVRKGSASGVLVVTLDGRPVDSWVRMVGTNGTLLGDFVRGTTQRLIGPGSSGIDKALQPFRLSSQMSVSATAALARRIFGRRSYPGLGELFEAFYRSVVDGAPSPTSPESILETARIQDQVAAHLQNLQDRGEATVAEGAGLTVVTGGTGLLGTEVVRALLAIRRPVRVLARRLPAPWERIPGVEYRVADLGSGVDPEILRGAEAVIHCAAATAGGRDDHQRDSVDATEKLVQTAAAAGVRSFVHVSSVAVQTRGRGERAIREESPLVDPEGPVGPYVWGKAISEKRARELASGTPMELAIVRPGPIIDPVRFDPPGRLGRRIGNLFVAAGSPSDPIPVVDVDFAARLAVWRATSVEGGFDVVNAFNPRVPTRRELVARLRQDNPGLRVFWLRRPLLVPLSWGLRLVQKVLRPGRPAVNLARAFASESYDLTRVAAMEAPVERYFEANGQESTPGGRGSSV